MSDFDKPDKGLQPNQRWGGDNLNSEVPQKFPFEAFETDDPNQANPTIGIKSPWFLNVDETITTKNLNVTEDASIKDLTVTNSADFQKGATTPFMHVQDQKASATDGGTFTNGAWRTRDLNTVVTNTITGASLSANAITLPTGTYYIEASAPSFDTARHRIRLYNSSDTVTELEGQNAYNIGTITNANLTGRFTISGTKIFIIEHRAEATQATNGFGISFGILTTIDHETYSDVKIWRLA